MKRGFTFLGMGITGIALIVLGVFWPKSLGGEMSRGLCFGIGGTLAAIGIGSFIQAILVSGVEGEDVRKYKNIEVNDERNTRIREMTGYRVSQIMNYLLLGYVLFLGFMKAGLIFIIPALALLLIELALVVYFSQYYGQKI